MRQQRLWWRIYFSFFASTILALIAIAGYATFSLHRFQQDQVAEELLVRARLIADEVASGAPDTEGAALDRLCKNLGRLTRTRITIVRPDGRVAGDSEENPAAMEPHQNRPEIAAALKGATGKALRFSDTTRQTRMYLAIPVRRNDAMVAVVRTSLPLVSIDWSLQAVYRQILVGAAIVGVLFAVVALILSRRISRPLEDMRRLAERLAQGELDARVPMPDCQETVALARALNQMAAQLGERMRIISEQRHTQGAVFTSMVEGVLAVDREERLLHLNPAAARMLGITLEQARGRSIQETIRHPELQKFIDAALAQSGVLEDEIVLYGNEDRFIQLHGTALTDAAGANIGALVVLNDITRLKRLETIRRDFVANVSHELKTPITALKGGVETLTGTIPAELPDGRRFIALMARQVDRLAALVEDLLRLSQVEFDTERGRILLESGSVADVLRSAVQSFKEPAEQKKTVLTVECPDDLTAPINAALLEQAVGNLIDNAIKYSGDGTRVMVSGTLSGDAVEIRVADQGPGIEKKHLPRIFERFYRVDQARSRALGGTGLGLAIVKHIALAHRGTAGVASTPGQGSIFTIRIPRR